MSAPAPATTVRLRGRSLQGRRAGVVTRVAAAAIDLAVILVGLAAGDAAVAGGVFLLHPRGLSWATRPRWGPPVAGVVPPTPHLPLCLSGLRGPVGGPFLRLPGLRPG